MIKISGIQILSGISQRDVSYIHNVKEMTVDFTDGTNTIIKAEDLHILQKYDLEAYIEVVDQLKKAIAREKEYAPIMWGDYIREMELILRKAGGETK
jgi:hypothetical protein